MSPVAQPGSRTSIASESRTTHERGPQRGVAMPSRRSSRALRSRALLALKTATVFTVVAATACGGSASATSPDSTPSASRPAPDSLQGVWATILPGTAERVTLTIGALTYQIVRSPNQATGSVSVTGDRIDFSGSSACTGTGAYRWSISASRLQFTAIAADQCPGRSDVVAGLTYNKGP